jgi:hypothetical protein
MDLIHQAQKPAKHYDEVKLSELKENIDFPIENFNEKSKQNSSTTSRNPFLNGNSNTLAPTSEEIAHNKSNGNSNEENGKNNGKIEDHKKPVLNDMPFINYSKKRKNSLHYIRVRKADVLPRNDIYEVSDDDVDFISNLNKMNNDPNLLSNEVFEQLIMLWENNSEKDYPIGLPQARSLTNEKLEKNLFNKIEDVFNVIF